MGDAFRYGGHGPHVDYGCNGDGFDFDLSSYTRAPWVVAIVLLTDVHPEGGATLLKKGHRP